MKSDRDGMTSRSVEVRVMINASKQFIIECYNGCYRSNSYGQSVTPSILKRSKEKCIGKKSHNIELAPTCATNIYSSRTGL